MDTVASQPVSSTVNERLVMRSIAVAALVAILVFLFHLPYTHSNYLLSDAADYARAARSPNLKTYLDTNSASLVHLLQMRKDPATGGHLWNYLYSRQDNMALRHFHPPFSFYVMHIVQHAGDDSRQRVTVSLVTAFTCGVLAFGLSMFGVPLVIAGLAAFVAGIQSRYVEVSATPSPHAWLILFAALFLFIFARYLQTRKFGLLAIAAVLLACSFADLEFSLELVCAIPIALVLQFWVDRDSFGRWSELGIAFLKAVLIFLGTTLVLWPGGWLRGGYLEAYGVNGSMLLLQNKTAFVLRGPQSNMFEKLFSGHETLLLLFAFAFCATILLGIRRKLSAVSIVFLSYALVAFGLGIADHFRLDTYVSELLLFLIASTALLFQDLLALIRPAQRRLAVLAFALVLAVIGVQEWQLRPSLNLYRPWLQPVLASVSGHIPTGETILVNDYGEAFQAYLPGYLYKQTVSPTNLTPRVPGSSQKIHYLLLTQEAPAVPGASLIARYATAVPGHSVGLYLIK